MAIQKILSRLFAKLRVDKQHSTDAPVTGMVAAIVCINLETAPRSLWTPEHEEAVSARLERAVRERAGGLLDGTERDAVKLHWYFFARDVRTLEAALVEALRQEPDCAGAVVKLTSNGVVGPWREVRV
jgi:hypothetical protein